MAKYIFKPSRLYIKRHKDTGLMYFGKTLSEDVNSYPGSGKYWSRHIKKHGEDKVETIWVSDWFFNVEDIREFALAFSELFDIVKSEEWANLMEENGTSGGNTGIWDDEEWVLANKETRSKKISISLSLMYQSDEWLLTKRKQRKEKELETKSSPGWIENTWLPAIEKREERKRSEEWQSTVGEEQRRKHKEKINSPEWKSTTGMRKKAKERETKLSPEWKLANSSICPHCNNRIPNCQFNRWHNDNCKLKK